MTFHPQFNTQLSHIYVSLIRRFDEEVSKIPNILKLTLGEPDFDTPQKVKESGIKAIQENFSHYTNNKGLLELRKAAACFVHERYHLSYCPETEVIATIGATEAIAASLLTILNPGDKVILPTPIYPGYEPLIYLAGATPIFVDTTEDHFILKPEKIEKVLHQYKDQVKAVILNTPSNPTGVVYTQKELKDLAAYLKNTSLFVITDEVYSELTYGVSHESMGNYLKEQTIVINGLSKSHAMTGWRMGFIFAPEVICNEIVKVHQYLITSATTITQKAAITALTTEKDAGIAMKKEYKKRRDFVLESLHALGFKTTNPNGAFYIFAKIPKGYTEDSFSFCLDLAQKNQLALIPGISFGKAGEGHIRISYAASMEHLKEAMSRLQLYMEQQA